MDLQRAIASAISDYPFWFCVRRWEGRMDDHVGTTSDGHFEGAFGISHDAWLRHSGYTTPANRLPFANQVIGARRVHQSIGDTKWFGYRHCRAG